MADQLSLCGRALTQGTREGVAMFLEIVSLPDFNYFVWELIPQVDTVGMNVLLWSAMFDDGIAT